MLVEVLKPMNIVVKQLQLSGESVSSAIDVINGIRDELISTREELNEQKVERMVKRFLEEAHVSISEQEQHPRRTTNLASRFDEFIVTDRIPSENNAKSHVAIFAECLDLIENEFERRFSSENIKLWQAMEALSPNSNNFLDSDVLVPFFEYAQSVPVVRDFFLKNELSIQDLNAECRIFSRGFKDKQ